MATDPQRLRPNDLCRLLNSTPLGEVINEPQLRRHRTRAGLRIGEGQHVDLIRYVAWLVRVRHAPKKQTDEGTKAVATLTEAAEGAAGLGTEKHLQSRDQELTAKQEALIGALLTEPTHAAAAAKADVSTATVYRWLQSPNFRAAYRQARRELMESTIGRMQAASGQAVDTLLDIARQGRRDGDRVRAAVALIDRALRGLSEADVFHGGDMPTKDDSPVETADVVQLVAARLRQVEQSELSTSEKSRLTANLADALLRAIGVDIMDKRLEALEAVLKVRNDQKQ